MRSKKWLVLICIMTLIFVGCGKTENEDESSKEDKKVTVEEDKKEDVKQESSVEEESVETPSNTATQPSIGTTQSDKETNTITKPSTGANNTGSNANTGSNDITTKPSTGSNNSGSSDNKGSDTGNTTTHPVHEHIWVEVTEEKTHYYDWRSICGKCGTDLTDMTDEDLTIHIVAICGGGYSVKFIEVDYVTENIQKESIVTGYKCECGAEKK